MIVVSHFSCTFAKMLGNNLVSVFATLVLFSYTKILDSHRSCVPFLVAVNQWWSLHRHVCKCSGRFICYLTAVSYSVNVLIGRQHFIVKYSWTQGRRNPQPPQFLTFARRCFARIISCFIASRASAPATQSYFCSTASTFIGILAFQLANVTGITQYLKRKHTALKAAVAIKNQAEAAPKSFTSSLPDQLINPKDYELCTLQKSATAEPAVEGADDEAKEPVYTTWLH